jgi:putative zinc finger protein
VTCDTVQERLAEQLLGSTSGEDDLAIRRHLRGCAACRRDAAALGDGLAAFARAAHDVAPPDELRERVLGAVRDDQLDAAATDAGTPRRRRLLPAVAAVLAIALVASLAWGLGQTRRADRAASDAASYTDLLAILGGKDFRAARLAPASGVTLEGSVVVYDSHEDQSWAVVFIRAPGQSGYAEPTLLADDGRAVEVWPLEFDRSGDGATWLVTSVDLRPFDRLEVRGDDGTLLATADIREV